MDQIARLTALEEIRNLARRYAAAVDARDLDALVALYPPDVRAAKGRRGREALRADFAQSLSAVGVTFLLLGQHIINFESAARATGVVYCRAEIQDGGAQARRFVIQAIQYHDEYAKVEGAWYFTRRRHHLVYGAELGENPLQLPPANWPARQTGRGTMPHNLESWRRFWRNHGAALH